MLNKLIFAVSIITLGAAVTGCSVSTTPSDPSPTPTGPAMGTLTVGWTLGGSSSVDSCDYYQVDRVEVIIDDGAQVIADEEPVCEDFSISFDLPTGMYSSELTLLAPAGYGVSDTIITDVRVLTDTDAFVDVDFPDTAIQ